MTVWTEKYRPRLLEDVHAQTTATTPLRRLLSTGYIPHLLIHGPPGTGKTSTTAAIARELFPQHTRHRVLEMNASDERGIETVRERIKEFANCRGMFDELPQIIVLDEVDCMTVQAQMALRRLMDRCGNARFFLVCNQINKIVQAVRSRCMQFRYALIPHRDVVSRLRDICEMEGLDGCSEDTLATIAHICEGDLRRAVNILQASVNHNGQARADVANVYACTGMVTASQIGGWVEALRRNEDIPSMVRSLREFQTQNGMALADMVSTLYQHVAHTRGHPLLTPFFIKQLSLVESNLTSGAGETIQMVALGALLFETLCVPTARTTY